MSNPDPNTTDKCASDCLAQRDTAAPSAVECSPNSERIEAVIDSCIGEDVIFLGTHGSEGIDICVDDEDGLPTPDLHVFAKVASYSIHLHLGVESMSPMNSVQFNAELPSTSTALQK